MKINVGRQDKIIRILVSILLAVSAFIFNLWPLYIVALVLLITAFTGVCGLYALFGFSTCPRKKIN